MKRGSEFSSGLRLCATLLFRWVNKLYVNSQHNH